MLFKYNDKVIQSFEKLKKENKEIAIVLDWLEEFSTMKINRLDSKEPKRIRSPVKEKFCNNHKTGKIQDLEFYEEFKIIPCDSNEIKISDNLISTIEDISFNIFELKNEVKEGNILSTIGCYVFSIMGFYSFIDYNKFESFVEEITKGYEKKNPYHNENF